MKNCYHSKEGFLTTVYQTIKVLVIVWGFLAFPAFGQQIKIISGAYLKYSGAHIVVNGKVDNSGSIANSGTVGLTISGDFLNSGTFVAGAATHLVGGSWSNTGTFTATGSTVNFNGASASTIGASNFNHITISGAGTKTATGNITATGNFNLNAGQFNLNNATSYDMTIAGNFAQTGGIFDFNAGISGTCNLFLGGNLSQITGSGTMTTSGAGAPNGIVVFNGSGTQTVNFTTPGGAIWVIYSILSGKSVQLLSNISLSSADGVTQIGFQGEIQVYGTIDLGTYVVSQAGGVPGTAVFNVHSGASLITAHASGIPGSVPAANMTAIYSSGANYEFRGAITGAFTTTPVAGTVNNLTINNASDVVLTNSITVAGTLLLADGKFKLNANTLTLAGSSPTRTSGNIDALATGSTVQFSGAAAQIIPIGTFYNDGVYNLTVNNANHVTLYGNLLLLNALTASSGRLDAFTNFPAITYAGIAAQNIGSQFLSDKIYDLTIDNAAGVTLDANFTIDHNLAVNTAKLFAIGAGKALTVSGTITNSAGNAGFVLQSGAAGTASLLHNTASVPATVQRYISGAAEAWHFLSSPVAAQVISENQPFPASWLPSGSYGNGTGYDFYLWNEPNNCWIYYLNTTSAINWNTVHPGSNFGIGRGYLYSVQATNPTKTFAGNLNNGALTYSLTISSIDIGLKGFNLVGNPYPSAIDWQAASGWSRTNLVSSGGGYDMWIWNPAANNYGVFNSATGIGTNSVTRYIPSMQGYFVQATSAGNLGMDNAVRLQDGTGWFKNTAANPAGFSVVVASDADKSFDEVELVFGYAANQPGARKLFSNVVKAPSLFMRSGNEYYSVQYLTDTVDNPAVPVMFKPGQDGNYTLSCNFDFAAYNSVKLEDRQAKTTRDMKAVKKYSFKASKTDDANRFVLHFGPGDRTYVADLPAGIYFDGLYLVVDLTTVGGESEVFIYDASGRLLLQRPLQGSMQHKLSINAQSQHLIVFLKNQQGKMSRKIFYDNKFKL